MSETADQKSYMLPEMPACIRFSAPGFMIWHLSRTYLVPFWMNLIMPGINRMYYHFANKLMERT